jgi:DNA (cytosine-5)-methyltransferase 1
VTTLKAFDLCSGIGGFRAGVMLSNFTNRIKFVAYSDIDEYAIVAYNSMYAVTGETCLGDIQSVTRFENEFDMQGQLESSILRMNKINDAIPDFDILFAGFPCQSHSLMGNRKGNRDSRGNLFYDIKEIINAKRPEYFILENVRAIKSVNAGNFF